MPLLRRHRSATGSSSGSAGSPTSPTGMGSAPLGAASGGASSGSESSRQQQQMVCESPLFGLRHQLGGGKSPDGMATNATGTSNELSSIPQKITRQQIHFAFSIMDANKDGMIDPRELSQMLANLGVPIDEAILSHVVSTVSRRGDQRISEAEFLDWISHFIQISDLLPSNETTSSPASSSGRRKQQLQQQVKGGSGQKNRVARSSTASSSLEAQQPNDIPRNRRGSGSGLALMRSLSASASATAAAGSSSSFGSDSPKAADTSASAPAPPTQSPATSATFSSSASLSEADAEARDDLRAAFGVFDLDGDGFITFEEVRAGLKLLGESWSHNELRQLFARCSMSSSRVASSSSAQTDLSKQRISIDDFVQLLL